MRNSPDGHLLLGAFIWLLCLFFAVLMWWSWRWKVPSDPKNRGVRMLNNSTFNQDWKNYTYVFVGGVHQSGTSVTERLLASQSCASGLEINNNAVATATNCRMKNDLNPKKCISPENEGIFLTQQFLRLYVDRDSICALPLPSLWGQCAKSLHLTEVDISRLQTTGSADIFRENLLRDWNPYWNLSKPYLVEKDIPNLVKSRFFQSLFGANRVAFVFLLRHPMASCTYFSCDIASHVEAWLEAYSVMESDLVHLRSFIVLHMESYVHQPREAVQALEEFLGWDPMMYSLIPSSANANATGLATVLRASSNMTTKVRTSKAPKSTSLPVNASVQAPKPPRRARGQGGRRLESLTPQLPPNPPHDRNHQVHPPPSHQHRSLGYHSHEPAQRNPNNPDTTVAPSNGKASKRGTVRIGVLDSTAAWMRQYPYELMRRENAGARRTLQALDKRLRTFCYSSESLWPICGSVVWRRGEFPAPVPRGMVAQQSPGPSLRKKD